MGEPPESQDGLRLVVILMSLAHPLNFTSNFYLVIMYII